MSFYTVNPTTREKIKEYQFDSASKVEEKINSAHMAFKNWSSLSLKERTQYFKKLKETLIENIDEAAEIMSLEMGKVISEAKAEVKKCAKMIDYYCENVGVFLQDEKIETAFKRSFVAYKGQGVIFGIMPWNFPFWQALRFAVPSMLVGNTVMIKHAPNVQGSQYFLQSLFEKSNFPKDTFSTLVVDIPQIKSVIADFRVRGVSFTGSEKAGRAVGALAGEHLKKAVLELGGSDAYLVFADADLENAAQACVASRFVNAGQSCVAAKRWIVHKDVKESFTRMVLQQMEALKVGNPGELETKIGPMARFDLKDEIAKQVEDSVSKGASVLMGGPDKVNSEDCFYPVTLLDNVESGQPAFDEELFGPVASIISVYSDEEALSVANQSRFGLGGAVFSQNEERALELARDYLDTGGVFINDFYKSVPELPFGGVKASGVGRELSKFALYEFANIKTVVLAES